MNDLMPPGLYPIARTLSLSDFQGWREVLCAARAFDDEASWACEALVHRARGNVFCEDGFTGTAG